MNTKTAASRILFCLVLVLAAAGNSRDGTARAAEVYRIVPGESELRVLVFRSGTLAGLGHNHVVSSSALSGTVTAGDTAAASAVEILLPVASLVVDDPAVRAEEGSAFSAETSEKDVKGTRRNMLGPKLLRADQFDEIRIVAERIAGEFPNVDVEAAITIRGSRRVVRLPAAVERHDDTIMASGQAEISHAELGLSPFTAAFGTMRVGEEMTFKYRIVARKSVDGGARQSR
jgi:polyisoprenoid-binding protein YceI